MTNASDPRTGLKTRGSGLSTARVVLVGSVWLALVLIWNIRATESAALARGVAVLSVALLATVVTIRAGLRKVAFTAWVLACVVTAFCYPQVFLKWGDLQLKTLIVPLIQVIMFGMGATLTLADFTRVIKMPRAVIIGTVLQFSIMPLLGFLLATAFGFEASVAVGIILVGSCPGGVASNVMTYLAKGNVALSVTLTACSTLVAPIMTPFFMKLFAGTLVKIVFMDWVISIVQIIIIPIAAGLILNAVLRRLNRRGEWLDRCLSLVAMVGICFIIGIIIADSRDKLLTIGLALVAASVLHNLSGYLLGYYGSRLFRLDETTCRTVAIEVGLQNGGMATALAINVLKDPLAALAPAIFGPWMNISGSVLASWWGARPPAPANEPRSNKP